MIFLMNILRNCKISFQSGLHDFQQIKSSKKKMNDEKQKKIGIVGSHPTEKIKSIES